MRFKLFKVSVVPNSQIALFEQTPLTAEQKNELIVKSIHSKSTGTYWRREYRLYGLRDATDDAIYGQIARPDNIDVALPTDRGDELLEEQLTRYAWTHFIYLGTGQQIFAVAEKGEFFSGGTRGLANIIRAILSEGWTHTNHTIDVQPLSNEKDFWTVIGEATEVRLVRFDLVTPNGFGGSDSMRAFLDRQRTQHHATHFSQIIENRDGALSFDPHDDEIRGEVAYVSRGGGRARIAYSDSSGRSRRWSSDQSELIAAVEVEADDIPSILRALQEIIRAIRDLL